MNTPETNKALNIILDTDAPCSLPLLNPADAPKDGTKILAAVGWPWLVPAVWDDDGERWAIVNIDAEVMEWGTISRSWENDSEPQVNLAGWLPWPEMPGCGERALKHQSK